MKAVSVFLSLALLCSAEVAQAKNVAKNACRADLARLCPGQTVGQCNLPKHMNELSPICRHALMQQASDLASQKVLMDKKIQAVKAGKKH